MEVLEKQSLTKSYLRAAAVVFGIIHSIKITCIVAIVSCVWDLQSILFRITIEM
jgi:hypothetical protein